MGLNVLKEQLGLGRFQNAMAGDRGYLVSLPVAHGTGLSPWCWAAKGLGFSLGSSCCTQGGVRGGTGFGECPKGVWGVGDTGNRVVLG